MDFLLQPGALSILAHLTIVVVVGVRVIMMRPLPGVALAWLLLVLALPAVGVVLYVLFGERRVGRRRAHRLAALRPSYTALLREGLGRTVGTVDWSRHGDEAERMDRLARGTLGIPAVTGNRLRLCANAEAVFHALAADIDAASRTVHLETYIWRAGGAVDAVADALIRAAGRGVHCRILVDHLGGRPWLASRQAAAMRRAGVTLGVALPVGLLRSVTARNDLRLHRKIAVLDGRIAWTGSMNMVDPRYFKQEAGVGQWIDAVARVEGPASAFLNAVVLADWQRETAEPLESLLSTGDLGVVESVPGASSDLIVFPSGPGESDDAILQMLLSLVYAAREELVVTTPYFVPDDSMLRALRTAAQRGVAVDLVVPRRTDSLLVRYASRSYYADLMTAGVRIQQFRGGLLHTKSITVDGRLSVLGTVNLDLRSLWLNYEVSLVIFDEGFGGALRALQQTYLDQCRPVDPRRWGVRRFRSRFLENTARLVSPLL